MREGSRSARSCQDPAWVLPPRVDPNAKNTPPALRPARGAWGRRGRSRDRGGGGGRDQGRESELRERARACPSGERLERKKTPPPPAAPVRERAGGGGGRERERRERGARASARPGARTRALACKYQARWVGGAKCTRFGVWVEVAARGHRWRCSEPSRVVVPK